MIENQSVAKYWHHTVGKCSNMTNPTLHTSMVAPPSIAMFPRNNVAWRKRCLDLYCHSPYHAYHPPLFWINCKPCFHPNPCSPMRAIFTKGQVPWEGVASTFYMPTNSPLHCEIVYNFTLRTQDTRKHKLMNLWHVFEFVGDTKKCHS